MAQKITENQSIRFFQYRKSKDKKKKKKKWDTVSCIDSEAACYLYIQRYINTVTVWLFSQRNERKKM